MCTVYRYCALYCNHLIILYCDDAQDFGACHHNLTWETVAACPRKPVSSHTCQVVSY